MSELKTNKISTNDQNNVAIDNALGLKSYTEAQRDALTAVAGDVVYNNENGTIDFYNGSAWFSTSSGTFTFTMDYLIIAGGAGGGGDYGGGGGAGGYRNSYASENTGGGGSSETSLTLNKGTSYGVTVGAGQTTNGVNSTFATITSTGGGQGGGAAANGTSGGSGGGGAGASGTSGADASNGTVNLGGGGGGAANHPRTGDGGTGGSGVVIIRYPTLSGTLTIGAGLTGSTSVDDLYTVATIYSRNRNSELWA